MIGLTTFSGWALADTGTVNTVAIAVDSAPSGNATYGATRIDICALYSSANCPNVGWSFPLDTTLLADGSHTLDATVTYQHRSGVHGLFEFHRGKLDFVGSDEA